MAKSLYTTDTGDTADSTSTWGNLGLHPTAVCDQMPQHILAPNSHDCWIPTSLRGSASSKLRDLYTDTVQDTADSTSTWVNLGLHRTAVCECGLSDQMPQHILQTCPIIVDSTWPETTTLKTKLWSPLFALFTILLFFQPSISGDTYPVNQDI
jgi:hypothetical protein